MAPAAVLALSLMCPAAAQTAGDVKVDGIVMHYATAGSGPPLVLLHHFGWSGKVWDPFLADLSKDHRVIVIDLPGHGGSTGWNEVQYSYPRNTERVLQLLDKLNVSSFDAIGASLGAVTLLQAAAMAPSRIHRMVLASATPTLYPQTIAWLNENACGPVTEQDIRDGLPYQSHGREQVIGLAKMFCNERTSSLAITAAQMHAIQTATLVVHGDHDRIFPLESAVTIFQNIPHAQLWVQPGAGHVFLFKEQFRAAFIDAALRFLRSPS